MYLINKDETEHTGQVRPAPPALDQEMLDQRTFSQLPLVQHFNPLVLHKSRRKKQRVGLL